MMLCICAASAVAAGGEPEVTQTFSYYHVSGGSIQQLNEQLARLGPPDESGRRYHAFTSWYVRWNYRYVATPGRCALGRIWTTVTVTIRFPQWDQPSGVSKSLARKWDAYVAALQNHENGHRDIGVEAARAIEKRLEALPPQPTCEQLAATANAAGDRLLDDARSMESLYDRTTDHGATQGARLQ